MSLQGKERQKAIPYNPSGVSAVDISETTGFQPKQVGGWRPRLPEAARPMKRRASVDNRAQTLLLR